MITIWLTTGIYYFRTRQPRAISVCFLLYRKIRGLIIRTNVEQQNKVHKKIEKLNKVDYYKNQNTTFDMSWKTGHCGCFWWRNLILRVRERKVINRAQKIILCQ